MKKSTIIAAMAAACALPLAALPSANAADDYKLRVDRDLLQSSSGIAELHRNLDRQAKDICQAEGINIREMSRFRNCKQQVLDIAVEEIGHSRLTAYHNGEEDSVRLSRQ